MRETISTLNDERNSMIQFAKRIWAATLSLGVLGGLANVASAALIPVFSTGTTSTGALAAPNSADSNTASEDTPPDLKKSTRGGRKGAKKGNNNKTKNAVGTSMATAPEVPPAADTGMLLSDEHEPSPSPDSDEQAAEEDLMQESRECKLMHTYYPRMFAVSALCQAIST